MTPGTKEVKKIKYQTKDVTKPIDGLVVNKERFWLCEEGDPTRALFVWKTPQCNKDKRILEWSLSHPFKDHNNIQIVFIELAYVPQIA